MNYVSVPQISAAKAELLTLIIVDWDFLARHTMMVETAMQPMLEGKKHIIEYFYPR
jgi:hypothetical protein